MRRVARALRAAIAASLVAVLLAAPAAAGEFRSDQTVTVAAGETVADDLYVAGGTVTVDGTVDGDLSVGSGMVTVAGEVTGSVNVAAGTVTISGTVGGAVRAAAGTITIDGSVGRDVVALGGTVTIGRGAEIAGDVAGGVGSLVVDGRVAGGLLAGAGTITVNGTVEGSLEVAVDELVIGPQAGIGGDVTYTSDREARIDAGASIGGAITRRDAPDPVAAPLVAENPILTYLGLLLGLIILGWGLLLVRPRLVTGTGAELRERPLVGLGIGLAAWLGQFVLALALLILAGLLGALAGSLGGALVLPAVIVILLIVLVAVVAQVPVAMALGDLILRGPERSAYLAYAAGAAIWAALLLVAGLLSGVLGFIVYLAAWVLGLGAFTVHAWRTREVGTVVVTPTPPPPATPAPPTEPAT